MAEINTKISNDWSITKIDGGLAESVLAFVI